MKLLEESAYRTSEEIFAELFEKFTESSWADYSRPPGEIFETCWRNSQRTRGTIHGELLDEFSENSWTNSVGASGEIPGESLEELPENS